MTQSLPDRLKPYFQQLEERRIEICQQLAAEPADSLNLSPDGEKWSALQVLKHLILVEQSSLRYMQKKTLDPSRVGKVSLNSRIKMQLMLWLMPMRKLAPLPAPKAVRPSIESFELAVLCEEWAQSRVEFKAFLSALSPDLMDRAMYKHPVPGRISLIHGLRFLITHIDRHRKQVRQTLKQVQMASPTARQS